MSGSVRHLGRDKWQVRYEIGTDADGRRIQKSFTWHGKRREAEAELRRRLEELDNRPRALAGRDLMVGQYLTDWLESISGALAPKTRESYEAIIKVHLIPAFGARPLRRLTALDIETYYRRALDGESPALRDPARKTRVRRLSARTVLHHHRLLRKALGDAVRKRMLAWNPVDQVTAPKAGRHEAPVLTDAEIRDVLAQARGHRLYLPILLAVVTGMRRGEILALRWKDIDFETGEIRVTRSLSETRREGVVFKGPKSESSRRVIRAPQALLEALREHKAAQAKAQLLLGPDYTDHGLVLPTATGAPWHPNRFTNTFRPFMKRLGYGQVSFHGLRHSHATELLRANVHPKIVSERLGHRNIFVTLDTYSHVLPDLQQTAADVMDANLAGSGAAKNGGNDKGPAGS